MTALNYGCSQPKSWVQPSCISDPWSLHSLSYSSDSHSDRSGDSTSQTSEDGFTDNTSPYSSQSSDQSVIEVKPEQEHQEQLQQDQLNYTASRHDYMNDTHIGNVQLPSQPNHGTQHALPLRMRDDNHGFNSSQQHQGDPRVCTPTQHKSSAESCVLPSRRRSCMPEGQARPPPPKLRRDTDCTDAIVKLIVVFCTHLIQTFWPVAPASATASMSSGNGVLPLQVFITETLRRSKTSYSTLQVALYYLILLRSRLARTHGLQESSPPGCRALQCGRRMFLTALILASKYLQDRNYSARAWSKISGLPLKEINENERNYLAAIEFDLHVPKEVFENWSKLVLAVCRLSGDHDPDSRPPGSSVNLLRPIHHHKLQSMCDEASSIQNWWSASLRRLSPEIVSKLCETDRFLSTVAPFMQGTREYPGIMEDCPEATLLRPQLHNEKLMNLTPRRLSRTPSHESLSQCTTPTTASRTGSPASFEGIPPQPMLRNLPTPQTTPQVESSSIWSNTECRPNPRCKASLSALTSVGRQNLVAANLETCPPPQPRRCALARSNMSRQWRDQTSRCSSSIASSPESVVSDISTTSTRSRTSSISSISSTWTSSQGGWMAPKEQSSSVLQSLVTRPTPQQIIYGPRCMRGFSEKFDQIKSRQAFDDEGIDLHDRPSEPAATKPQLVARLMDEGYGSDGYSLPEQKVKEQEVARALVSLASCGAGKLTQRGPAAALLRQQTCPSEAPRDIGPLQKHKRTLSTVSDSLQDETRRLLFNGKQSTSVASETWLSDYAEFQEKQMQSGTQNWATARTPVSVGKQNKRIAVQQVSQCQPSDLALSYLSSMQTACVRT